MFGELVQTVIRRVFEGGEGVIRGGKSERSSDSGLFVPDDRRLMMGGVCIVAEGNSILVNRVDRFRRKTFES